MGEASRRQDSDPLFGRYPKAGRGIVLSPSVGMDQSGSLTIKGKGVDPVELRRAVLFWDRLNRPRNAILRLGLNPDEQFLAECGLLQEISVPLEPMKGSFGDIYSKSHLSAFAELEKKEPGLWTMSEGENSFNLHAGGGFSNQRGVLVELHRAIPLPTGDTPLEDLLNFKEKRRDEILSLVAEIDGLFSRVANSKDLDFEMARAVREIDQKCADVISVGKESSVKFSLSDFTFGFSLEVNAKNLAFGTFAALMGTNLSLPVTAAVVGGAAVSCINFNLGLGGRLERSKKRERLAFSPYRVVSRLANEPI